LKDLVLASVFVLFSLVMSFSLYGDDAKVSPETSGLEARVEERWEAISAYDFLLAYKYQTPAYKKVFPKELYVSSFSRNVIWKLMGVSDIKFDKETGIATVEIDLKTRSVDPIGIGMTGEISSKITEKWLHIDDQWWHSSGK